jgi:hypothetical protein
MLYYNVITEDFDNTINLDTTIQSFEDCEDEVLSERTFYDPKNRENFSILGNFYSIYTTIIEIEDEASKENQKIFVSFLKDETQYYIVNVIDSKYGSLFYAAKSDNVFDLMQYLYDQSDSWSYVPSLKDYFDPIVASLPQRVEKKQLESNINQSLTHSSVNKIKI